MPALKHSTTRSFPDQDSVACTGKLLLRIDADGTHHYQLEYLL